ncbi:MULTISPECIES: hypothetical protein [unclassified Nocardioides]|uniref:hypothetical protein n=1 Tax=Nocardioides sp. XL1 TaxID=2003120 RepID=UPI001EE46434|nr:MULTISPECIES: hypothetical protein [unclassified Nocardioides]
MPNSQPANSSAVPSKSWTFSAAISHASAARSSAAMALSPLGRVLSQTSRRPAWLR